MQPIQQRYYLELAIDLLLCLASTVEKTDTCINGDNNNTTAMKQINKQY
jgi:hypothetical protein